jgi:hypothetical protein
MPTATLASPAVSDFAAAVRAALSDLSPEEVDDLTDGLEADLTDRLAESDASDLGDPDLGDPAAYAEELRAAAGLPHRAARRSGLASGFASGLAELRTAPAVIATDLRRFVATHPRIGRLGAFCVALRPVWWVFRAVVVTEIIAMGIGGAPVTGFAVILGIGILVLSVQFGRGRWLPFAWMRGLLLAANILLVIATPFVIGGWATQLNNAAYTQEYVDTIPDNSNDGLTENGNQVLNIYAYDAQGNPLTNVQLFDQDGKPLDLVGDPGAAYANGSDGSTVTVPNDAVTGRPGWNVFPLAQVKQSAIADDGTIKSSAHRIPAELPFATAKPLAGSEATPTAAPSMAPTPAP